MVTYGPKAVLTLVWKAALSVNNSGSTSLHFLVIWHIFEPLLTTRIPLKSTHL